MAILRPNEPIFMTADQAVSRRGYAGRAELALRNAALDDQEATRASCRNVATRGLHRASDQRRALARRPADQGGR